MRLRLQVPALQVCGAARTDHDIASGRPAVMSEDSVDNVDLGAASITVSVAAAASGRQAVQAVMTYSSKYASSAHRSSLPPSAIMPAPTCGMYGLVHVRWEQRDARLRASRISEIGRQSGVSMKLERKIEEELARTVTQ